MNPHAAYKRHDQGWVDVIVDELDALVARVKMAKKRKRSDIYCYCREYSGCVGSF